MWHERQWEGTLLHSSLQTPLCVLKLPAKFPGISAHFALPGCIYHSGMALQNQPPPMIQNTANAFYLPLTADRAELQGDVQH